MNAVLCDEFICNFVWKMRNLSVAQTTKLVHVYIIEYDKYLNGAQISDYLDVFVRMGDGFIFNLQLKDNSNTTRSLLRNTSGLASKTKSKGLEYHSSLNILLRESVRVIFK